MRVLRSPIFMRCVASAMVVSLLVLTVVPTVGHRNAHSYGDWLRSQLRIPVDASFDEAIAEAEEVRHADVRSFLQAFVDAYEGPDEDIAAALGMEGLEGTFLVSYLQSRFTHLSPDAVLSRTLIGAAQQVTSVSDRLSALVASGRVVVDDVRQRAESLREIELLPTAVSWLLSVIHPRAP